MKSLVWERNEAEKKDKNLPEQPHEKSHLLEWGKAKVKSQSVIANLRGLLTIERSDQQENKHHPIFLKKILFQTVPSQYYKFRTNTHFNDLTQRGKWDQFCSWISNNLTKLIYKCSLLPADAFGRENEPLTKQRDFLGGSILDTAGLSFFCSLERQCSSTDMTNLGGHQVCTSSSLLLPHEVAL